MKKTNALKMRQCLGQILEELQNSGEPILVEKNAKPAAVLISLEDYQKRFVDVEADHLRHQIVASILNTKAKVPDKRDSLSLIHDLRK